MEKDYKKLYEGTFNQLREEVSKNKPILDEVKYLKEDIELKEKRIRDLNRVQEKMQNRINHLESIQTPDSIELDKLREESIRYHKLKSSIERVYSEAKRND